MAFLSASAEMLVQPDRVRLIAKHMHAQIRLSPVLLHSLDVQSHLDLLTQDMILRMNTEVWARDKERSVKVPATWWDHLKETIHNRRRTPLWVKKRLSIRYHYYDAHQFFPEFIPERNYGGTVEFFTYSRAV